jgi:hypothetical protein
MKQQFEPIKNLPCTGIGILADADDRDMWKAIIDLFTDEFLLRGPILCIASGRCTEAHIVVERLRKSKLSNDEIKRRILCIDKYDVSAERYGYPFVHEDFLQYNDDVKYNFIIGNPPYALDGHKQVHQAFMEHAIGKLNECGKLCVITPFQFMNSSSEDKFRETMLERCVLEHFKIFDRAFGGVNVDVACSIWRVKKEKEKQGEFSVIHEDGTQTSGFFLNGKFLFPKTDKVRKRIMRAHELLKSNPPLPMIRAGYKNRHDGITVKAIEGYKNNSTGVVIKDLPVEHSPKVKKFLEANPRKYCALYNEFVGRGGKKKPFDKPVDVVEGPELPPTNDRLIIIPTDEPEKLQWFLTHEIIQSIHDAFHIQTHLGTSMQGHVPDMHTLLADNLHDRNKQMLAWFDDENS